MSSPVNPRLASAPIGQEPLQFLKAIKGYEKEPIVSLEQACQPLHGIFDELSENIQIAKMNCIPPADGLTQDESASIHIYTMEWDEPDNSLYAKLNRALRTPERRLLKPWFKYLKLFLTALFKLPSVDCQLWRGVKEDLSHLYPKGEYRIWWSFSSCTTSLDVLQRPNFIGKSGTRTLFSIEGSKCGRNISRHSYYKNEDEILLLPGTYLEVGSLISRSDNFHIVHLRQAKPPYEVLVSPFADETSESNISRSHPSSLIERPFTSVRTRQATCKQTNVDDSSDDEPPQTRGHSSYGSHSNSSVVGAASDTQPSSKAKTSNVGITKNSQIQKNSKGYIEISYVDRTGNSIIIENTSILGKSTVNMTGWSLRKTIDSKCTNVYRFPDNFNAKSRVPVRIIARNTSKKESTITRRDGETILIADTIATWGVGKHATTQLIDDRGNEQAIYIQKFA